MTEIEYELYHHGVKGMKWGVRKKIKDARNASADRKIRRATTDKAHAKLELNLANVDAKARYSSPKKAEKLADVMAKSKATYQMSEIDSNYTIARQKARKDKSYKKSSQYIKAKKAYGKEFSQKLIYGTEGSHKIHTLMNKGKTEDHAKLEVGVEQALSTIAAATVVTLLYSASRNK